MLRENEMKHWKLLTIDYMTEESDGDNDSLVIYELLWRSKSELYYYSKNTIVPC